MAVTFTTSPLTTDSEEKLPAAKRVPPEGVFEELEIRNAPVMVPPALMVNVAGLLLLLMVCPDEGPFFV